MASHSKDQKITSDNNLLKKRSRTDEKEKGIETRSEHDFCEKKPNTKKIHLGSECNSSSNDYHEALIARTASAASVFDVKSSLSSVKGPSLPQSSSSPSVENKWQEIIHQCIHAIVSIRYSQVAAFDTEGPETSEATGFVVDSKNGIILTNRHVACAGPFVGEAIFQDHEEVDVFPIYRDPIHDFGFLKFDPSKVKYMDLHEIPLAPHLAKVGLAIRVVGNDAGEKLSILAGSISRLDRNVPDYGELTYNDFNTFYLQAASSTSGGSSGSPVLDINGNAVALQAGGHTKAATDFFFPLDRVARALKYLKHQQSVPRGTIQTQFLHRPFDEAKRLGLTDQTETLIRKNDPDEIGLLVVEVVLPKGPGSNILEEGDVLISINGQYLTKFVPFEEALDSNIGKEIVLDIERGGVRLSVSVTVQDLHTITPDRYLQIGGAKLNNLSYQLARQYCVPVEGVYVSEPAGMFRLDGPDHGWIIGSIDTKPIKNLDELVSIIQSIPDKERIPITFYSIMDIHTTNVSIVQIERHWSSCQMAIRNDKTGLWYFQHFGKPLPPSPIVPMTASFPLIDEGFGNSGSFFQSIVKVSYYMPCKLDGFPKSRRHGAGIVVDAPSGLVVVGKNIVPFDLGDLTITIADSIMIPGKVKFVHPTHNLAFIQYDPKLIGKTPVRSAPLVSKVDVRQGKKMHLVALNHNQRPVVVQTTITDSSTVTIPLSPTPRFRALNFDAITIDTPLGQQCSSGVLADHDGKIHALWLSFLGERNANGHDNEYHMGLSVQVVQPLLKAFKQDRIPHLRGLGAEFTILQISQARNMGLSNEWVAKIEAASPSKRNLFIVRRIETQYKIHSMDRNTASSLAENEASSQKADKIASAMEIDNLNEENKFKELDIVLAINGKQVCDIQDLDVSEDWASTIEVILLRSKQQMTLTIPTVCLEASDPSHVVVWAGALLQEPHAATRLQSKNIPSGIYVSARSKGSPTYMYGIAPTQWITHVNGKQVRNLDEFVESVKDIETNIYVRVKIMSFDMIPSVLSIKANLHYWPTIILKRDGNSDLGWSKQVL